MKLFIWSLEQVVGDDGFGNDETIDAGLVVILARNVDEARKAAPSCIGGEILINPDKVIDCDRRHVRPYIAYAIFSPLINIDLDHG